MPIQLKKRKIVQINEYSYIITLPKQWIKCMQLNKGDSLDCLINDQGNLVVARN